MALRINKNVRLIPKIIGWAIIIIIVGILAKIYIWESHYYASKTTQVRATATPVITKLAGAVNPSTTPLSQTDIDNYQVEATQPRYLTIERLKIHARVQIGKVNSNTLPVPDNIFDVSWFSGSSKPGEDGCILISGLSFGQNAQGVFYNLGSLEVGNKIGIETGSGDKYTYEVKEVSIITSADASKELPKMQSRLNGTETLSLVTTIDSAASSDYSSIAMVRATKVDN